MRASLPLLLFALLSVACSDSTETGAPKAAVQPKLEAPEPAAPPAVEARELGEVKNLHVCGDLWLSGQPAAADFERLYASGVRTLVSLREPAEMQAIGDEARAAEAGLAWRNVPFRAPEALTDEVFDTVRGLLDDEAAAPVLLYCGSANRVGAVWLAHRVLDQGIDVETARAEAREVGLSNEEYEARALDYVERHEGG